MKHTIPIIALATEVLMVLTKRKLRPDGFQTVEPPGSLAMPTYSCFSNSCTLTDCEMYKWDVHGLRQNNIPKLELLRDIKTLTHVNSNWPLSSIYIFFFFLFVTIKPSSFLFPHCRERKTKQNCFFLRCLFWREKKDPLSFWEMDSPKLHSCFQTKQDTSRSAREE